MQADKNQSPLPQDFQKKIGITIGDCNGIGPELILKTLLEIKINEHNTLIIYGQSMVFAHYMKILSIQEFPFQVINNVFEAKPKQINLINCLTEDGLIEPGIPNNYSGKLALKALEKARTDLSEGQISAVVTAPVSKSNLKKQGFKFPGQTEFFASIDPNSKPLMILVSDQLRIGLVTGHIPIQRVADDCTPEKVSEKLETMITSLKNDFGIHKPKIAVMGLNPHAGEEGSIGTEEIDWMKKLILDNNEAGQLIIGPLASDGLFGSGNYRKFDAILAMYHDQGLIPFKTLAFNDGVNYTAGLKFIRTSPDHGTAFDIAGKKIASPASFRSSIRLAIDLVAQRAVHIQ